MRYIFLSDIHSNLPALETVLKDLGQKQPGDHIVCLGDIVGYGPHPNEAMDTIYGLCDTIIHGNHDAYVTGALMDFDAGLPEYRNSFINPLAVKAVNHNARALNEANKQRLIELTVCIPMIKRDRLVFAHSSPVDPPAWYYIADLRSAVEFGLLTAEFRKSHIFVGHTHIPQIYTGDKGIVSQVWPTVESKTKQKIVSGFFLVPEDIGCLMVVPSVGQPRDRNPMTGYATYEPASGKYTVVGLQYDVARTQAAMSGFPQMLIDRLAKGR